jgi:outer membrane murein-binding lipoprotein Lpp
MAHRSALLFFALSLGLLQLTGCAGRQTTPTLADEMRDAAADIQVEADRHGQLAEDWERGQSLIASGERKIERGERRIQSAESDLQRGRREVSEGEAELSEGRRLVAASERRYEELRQSQAQAQAPRD